MVLTIPDRYGVLGIFYFFYFRSVPSSYPGGTRSVYMLGTYELLFVRRLF